MLSSGGYAGTDRETFDPERCIHVETFLGFVRETEPNQSELLKHVQKESARETLLDYLCRALISAAVSGKIDVRKEVG